MSKRRKPTPLQTWRAQLHLLVRLIQQEKKRLRTAYGQYKQRGSGRHQSRLDFLRDAARVHMRDREAAAEEGRRLWQLNKDAWPSNTGGQA